jgi:hypothetical protein
VGDAGKSEGTCDQLATGIAAVLVRHIREHLHAAVALLNELLLVESAHSLLHPVGDLLESLL